MRTLPGYLPLRQPCMQALGSVNKNKKWRWAHNALKYDWGIWKKAEPVYQ